MPKYDALTDEQKAVIEGFISHGSKVIYHTGAGGYKIEVPETANPVSLRGGSGLVVMQKIAAILGCEEGEILNLQREVECSYSTLTYDTETLYSLELRFWRQK